MSKAIIDGCTAATHIAYALSDVATIYPITPVASMGETADKWAMSGRKNIWGKPMQVKEMESELGAAGATHGAAAAGALATTFTASQGLLLMIPNMFKIAGELLPVVFHVGTRSLATHALSIFGDHQDVMACRSTGFAFLSSGSVQQTMDLALIAHLAAIEGGLPVVHFFDGWRTSNETETVELIDYDSIATLVDPEKIKAIRAAGLNPLHPNLRGSAQNPDVYFQNAEAANGLYAAFPTIVRRMMDKVAALTGRQYKLFDYSGASDPDTIIVAMGSGAEVAASTALHLNGSGYNVGVVSVRLFRPFDTQALMEAIPGSVKTIAVLDRCREPGADGEPLYKDVAAAVQRSGRDIRVYGGRYGLSSKEFSPAMVKAVFDSMAAPNPPRVFTVGINDDVSHLSLSVGPAFDITPGSMTQCKFYGIGADGTVGATRQLAALMGDSEGLYAQAYFHYSAKKSGGYTISELRLDKQPVKASYSIVRADYIGCNKTSYINTFDMLSDAKQGAVFTLNCPWKTVAEMEANLPAGFRRTIAAKRLRFYAIDATGIAVANGLGERVNTVMSVAFMKLMPLMPFDQALQAFKDSARKSYIRNGEDVVKSNIAAIDEAVAALTPIDYPASWTDCPEPAATIDASPASQPATPATADFIEKIARPCMSLRGDSLPVSTFNPAGILPPGTTVWEKRCIAEYVPEWIPDNCVQCTLCSLTCSHAAIRPIRVSPEQIAGAPKEFVTVADHTPGSKEELRWRIQVYPADCTGCGVCADICPGKALKMMPLSSQLKLQSTMLDYAVVAAPEKEAGQEAPESVRESQLIKPYLEFSGACGGCGETPYVKLLTQLFGSRLVIANATGCSSIWGANFPSNAYTAGKSGTGPAWGNSLFEDNAEYAFGIAAGIASHQEDYPAKPSVWAVGGDGWAYDIGFAGLDHVLAQNIDINILVLDTECYSNTGGQTSKATPLSAVTKYSADGKRTVKKPLGRMMMAYGTVYVASIALGANPSQALKALQEAEQYPGPSLVIAYCPCINHGIRAGMSHSAAEQRAAVKAGYWPLYRYDPRLESPLQLDYGMTPYADTDKTSPLISFINGESRYADLLRIDPTEAVLLQPRLDKRCAWTFDRLRYSASEKK